LAEDCPTSDLRISASGRVSLRYRFPKTDVGLSYQHYISSGSGFFAGATTDLAQFHAARPLGRVWGVFSDIGYSRNSRVQPLTDSQTNVCNQQFANGGPACPGVSANTYQFGFAGFGFHRMFGRTLHGFASYQFNELAFDNSFCGSASACNRISQRHVGTVGLDWTPRPVRID
jgi:hypothetical protein